MDVTDLAPGPAPQLPIEAFAARRKRVADELGDAVLVVATNPETTYSNDVHHPFRPHSDFWYLTGFAEPGCVLVLDGSGTSTLFMRPREPKAEIWTGRRLGTERADLLGIEAAHPIGELGDRIPGLIDGRPVHAIVDHDAKVAETLANHSPHGKTDLLARMRCIKDQDERAMLRKAAEVGMDGMRAALRAARSGGNERDVQAHLMAAYLRAGSTGPGYPPIVGAGGNAAVLHYIDNRAPIQAGDLVLVDAGCEWGYYNSDITRTVPADGDWSSTTKDLYGLVADAQQAAMQEVRPGNRLLDPHRAASRVLAEGLVERGIIDGDVEAALEPEGALRRHFMHGTSHFLGLDVHDVGAVKEADGESRILRPGMCITVEPGLYFNPDFARCPPELAGIGIRIENDVVVTEEGCDDLVAPLPTDADDVAALVHNR